MNNISIFENPDFGQIRTTEVDGKTYFAGKDIAAALGYVSTANAIAAHCKGVTEIMTPTNSGVQPMKYISEGDVYRLIAHSKLPSAEKFERWVFDEVLPSIRKHGAYMTDETLKKALTSPDFLIQLATELKQEQEKRKELESKIEQDKPKVIFADAVEASHTSILIGELAKILRQNGYEIGQNRLFAKLRNEGYLCKSGTSYNMPTQRSMEMGLFEIKETTVAVPNGSKVTKTTKVTGRGQIYFINKFTGGFTYERN